MTVLRSGTRGSILGRSPSNLLPVCIRQVIRRLAFIVSLTCAGLWLQSYVAPLMITVMRAGHGHSLVSDRGALWWPPGFWILGAPNGIQIEEPELLDVEAEFGPSSKKWLLLVIYQTGDVSISYWPIVLVFAAPSAFTLLTRTHPRTRGFEVITT